MAKKYLSPPNGSVNCEKLFSDAGIFLSNARRNKLSEDMISSIMKIKTRLKTDSSIYNQVEECDDFSIFEKNL